jgi:hypothetical protein
MVEMATSLRLAHGRTLPIFDAVALAPNRMVDKA